MTTELRPSVQVEVSQSLAQIVLVLGPQGAGRASEKVPVPRGGGGREALDPEALRAERCPPHLPPPFPLDRGAAPGALPVPEAAGPAPGQQRAAVAALAGGRADQPDPD